MSALPSIFLIVSYGITAAALGYAIGTQHARILRWFEKWSNTMPSKPNGPRPPGRYVRQQLQEIDIHAGAADRRLEGLAETNIDAARAQGLLRLIQVGVARLLGMGVDDEDNGNGTH